VSDTPRTDAARDYRADEMSEVKLRLAIRDLYRGDGGPLNDYNQGWNDGVDAAAEILYPLVERAESALKDWYSAASPYATPQALREELAAIRGAQPDGMERNRDLR